MSDQTQQNLVNGQIQAAADQPIMATADANTMQAAPQQPTLTIDPNAGQANQTPPQAVINPVASLDLSGVAAPTPSEQPAPADPRLIAQQNMASRETSASDLKLFDKIKPAAAKDTIRQGITSVRDIIAPSSFVVTPNFVQVENYYAKTLFVFTYPRYIETNWLSPVVNFDVTMDISLYIHPLETKDVMIELRNQVGKLQSTMSIEAEKGKPRDPEMETALGDVEALRDVLQRGEVRLFQFGLYFTVYASTPEELRTVTDQLESTLGGLLIYTKEALFQMEQGFNTTLPLLDDKISVLRNLDTASLSSTFPFSSSELTQENGILYGINRHNNSLIIFDRFSLENANSIVLAKSGSGKSYFVKLEALRYLMFGADVIVIDPENEYKPLCEAVGGSYLEISLNSDKRINPFDLPTNSNESGEDVLRSNIASLHGLINIMVNGLSPEEDAIVDKALFETYAIKDITTDPQSQLNEPPLLQDFYNVLSNLQGTESLRARLSKFVEGTFANLYNQRTNFELKPGFVVFSVRDLEEQLRPIAIYTVLDYIWTKVRMNMRRRLMIVDEAWWMMQYEDSAKFLYGLAKRARKYYLGLTIISQDVEDFLASRYGKAVVANSSMQVLMKQSTASVDIVAEVFNLTEGEKYMLLETDVGEGLFFAGLNHVAFKAVASYTEDQIITTDPRQLLGE
jgi:type IV secretory pathway VirB4 component